MVFFVSGVNVIGLGLGMSVGGMFFVLGGSMMLNLCFGGVFVVVFEIVIKVICFF